MSETSAARDGDERNGDVPDAARRAVDIQHARDSAAHSLGIEVLAASAGSVRLAMRVRSDMLNGHGICHGGLVFTLADTAFAYACNSHGVAMVAAGASIEFLAPASLGERLIATASETSRGERHGLYDVTVCDQAGAVRAHFRGRCARLRAPPPHSTQEGLS
jgi:phenylacetic acid degradation protein PaaD